MMERRVNPLAVAPLVGEAGGVEHSWLGASLGKLLTEHLAAAGLPVLHYNAVGEATLKLDKALPFDKESAQAVMRYLRVSTLVAGGFRLEGGQLSLSLDVISANAKPTPLTDAAPTATFAPFIERVALALVKRLGITLDEEMRRQVRSVPRPRDFEAFRQLARARAVWAEGDYPLALSLAESALAMDPALEEVGEIKIGVARAADNPDAMREGFELWARLAGRNGRPLVRAERLLLFGHWLLDQGAWDEAREQYQAALTLYEGQGHRLGLAQALENLAGMALRQGRPGEAIATYRKSISVYDMLGARREAATATFNLALGFKAQGQTQAALEAINGALDMARELKDRRLEAVALDQRGTIHAETGDLEAAQRDYERALELYEAESDLSGLATVKDHLATLSVQVGDYAAAEALHLEAVALFERLGDAHELAVAWANLATLYMEMGAHGQAWDYALRAHEVFTRLGSGMQQLTAQLLDELG